MSQVISSNWKQPLGMRWHDNDITSHFIQIGQSLVFLVGFRWGCMVPFFTWHTGARDIFSKPCVSILYDPITRNLKLDWTTPKPFLVEGMNLLSVEPTKGVSFASSYILKGKVPVPEQKIVLDWFHLLSCWFPIQITISDEIAILPPKRHSTNLAWLASSRVGSSTKAPGPMRDPRLTEETFPLKINQQLPWIWFINMRILHFHKVTEFDRCMASIPQNGLIHFRTAWMRLTFGVGTRRDCWIYPGIPTKNCKLPWCTTWLMTSILVESTAIGPSFVLDLITNRHVLWLSLVSVRQIETQRMIFQLWPVTLKICAKHPLEMTTNIMGI